MLRESDGERTGRRFPPTNWAEGNHLIVIEAFFFVECSGDVGAKQPFCFGEAQCNLRCFLDKERASGKPSTI